MLVGLELEVKCFTVTESPAFRSVSEPAFPCTITFALSATAKVISLASPPFFNVSLIEAESGGPRCAGRRGAVPSPAASVLGRVRPQRRLAVVSALPMEHSNRCRDQFTGTASLIPRWPTPLGDPAIAREVGLVGCIGRRVWQ